jgi:hypothetical protein
MAFFEPPPPDETAAPPAPAPYGPPIWTGPSQLILGTAIPVNHIFAKTETVAVTLETLHAYPNGMTLNVVYHLRPPVPMDTMQRAHMEMMRAPAHGPRLGFEFSDGRRVGDRSDGGMFDVEKDDDGIPTSPVLLPQGGGGNTSYWQQGHWLWPLPSAGPLTVHFGWVDQGIDDSTLVLDGAQIRYAGEHATELWATGRDTKPGAAPGTVVAGEVTAFTILGRVQDDGDG